MPSKSDIPFAGDFSPNEVDLAEVLDLAVANAGNREALNAAVRARYYEHRPIPDKQKKTLAYNVTLGMEKYGLMEKDASLTDIGRELWEGRSDPAAMHKRFAQHILLHLPGATLVECLRDMHVAGEPITLVTVRQALLDRGVHTPTANKHISLMRLWLEKAGLFRSQWGIHTAVYEELLGLTEPEIEALARVEPPQRAVLKMLAALGLGPVNSSDLRKATEKAYGVSLNEKQFPKDVLYPLRDHGFVTLVGGKAKPFTVTPTPKLNDEVTIPLLDQLAGGLDPRLRELLTLPLPDIVVSLDSTSGYEKGLALEALGFKMLRTVGLDYRFTRYRPESGGRFEVDLLFDSSRLAYSRWQVQCKNTSAVHLDDLAKEVGLTYYLLSSVIVTITRGTIGAEARRYAIDVMKKTNLAIVMIDGEDVAEIVDNPLSIFDVLNREAASALELKPLAT